MVRRNFRTAGICAAVAATALFVGYCGNQSGAPVSSGAAEDAVLTKAFAAYDVQSDMRYGGVFGVMGSVIDLSADQKQQVKAILEKYHAKGRPAFDGKRPTREQWMAHRDSMKTRIDSIKNEIESVLTSDQKALLEQIRAQLKSGVVPDTLVRKRVERLTTLLTLTQDQQTQAFTILKQEMLKRLAARGKDSAFVHDSTHAWGMHRRGMVGKHNGRLGFPAEFLNILTAAQKQVLQEKASLKQHNDSAKYSFHGKKPDGN